MLMMNYDAHVGDLPARSFWQSARRACQEWERLRILYNAALICWVVYLVNVSEPALFKKFTFWAACGVGAIVANILYFAGPLAETSLNWIDFRHRSIRCALWLIGTQIAALLAGGVLTRIE